MSPVHRGGSLADVLEAQLGRPTRGERLVAARCLLGLPVAIRVDPVLPDGTPFPTLYWLTCPVARVRIARIEAAGGVARYIERAETDPIFGRALAAAHDAYRVEREALLPEPRPDLAPGGGIAGGTEETSVKCLHAHYAHTLGGGDNPIGAELAAEIEPLDCTVACVVDGLRNPAWAEPSAPGPAVNALSAGGTDGVARRS